MQALGSAATTIVLFEDGREDEQQRKEAEPIDVRTALIRMGKKNQGSAGASVQKEKQGKGEKQGVACHPPELQEEHSTNKGCRCDDAE